MKKITFPEPTKKNCWFTKNSGGRIGAEKFTGAIDSCGDPESSFQDISNR